MELIYTHWEDILRVAGSLKSGKVNATELTKSLQRNGQPTPLGKAITEYGKVYKTKHQLRYISDEIYARQILEQLNKGKLGMPYAVIFFMDEKENSTRLIMMGWKSSSMH